MTTRTKSTQDGLAGQLIEEGEAFRRLTDLTPSRVSRERFDVIVIGGGQAGLSVGYPFAVAAL